VRIRIEDLFITQNIRWVASFLFVLQFDSVKNVGHFNQQTCSFTILKKQIKLALSFAHLQV